MRRPVALLLLTITVLTLAGCGGSRRLGAFSECPQKLPFYAAIVPTPPHATAVRRAQAVAQDPRAAELCVYDAHATRGPEVLAAHAVLTTVGARTLTLLIDARDATDESCDGGYPALVRLRYAGGSVSTLLAAGCDPELLRGPSGVGVLPDAGSTALSSLVDSPQRGDRGIRTPSYVGRALAATAPLTSALARAGGVQADGVVGLFELVDPSAPFGEVVWQTPLASSLQDRGAPFAELVVAVDRAPACRAAQLRGQYLNGAFGTGNHFGTIVVLDASPGPLHAHRTARTRRHRRYRSARHEHSHDPRNATTCPQPARVRPDEHNPLRIVHHRRRRTGRPALPGRPLPP